LTRPVHADAIRVAGNVAVRSTDLTQSETRVLMRIAYFQPITRAALGDFFGKEVSRDQIGTLRAHDLIASGPCSPTPGAPDTYVTTKAFLAHFGLGTLRDLPDREALEEAGLLSKDSLGTVDGLPSDPSSGERL
jgi:segregation and condensation protein B